MKNNNKPKVTFREIILLVLAFALILARFKLFPGNGTWDKVVLYSLALLSVGIVVKMYPIIEGEEENLVYIPHVIELVEGKYIEVKAVSPKNAMNVYGRLKSTLKHDKTLILGDIVVEKPHRNRGIGSCLLNEFLSLAEKEGVKEITGNLSTVDDRDTLIHFYSKFGFEIKMLDKPDGNNTFATIHKYL